MWALVQVRAGAFVNGERKIVTALLIRNSQVATGLPPLCAMGQDAASTRAKLSENMRQFVPQSAIDFVRMVKQPRV
jgi:hypothetical protein